MHRAEFIMWIITTLLGCWSAAVFLRLLDEYRFFRRYPASPAPRVAARWAGMAGATSAVAAVATGVFAVWFARAYPTGRSSGMGVYFAAGLASGLFAAGMWAVWARGEPARGRRRCTRCTYDMSLVPSLRCPECGKQAADERGLLRARRPRWVLRTAIVVSLFSASMLALAPRSADSGALGIMPGWVLMLGSEHVPDGWIHGADGSLDDRITTGSIGAGRLDRFGSALIRTMIEDPAQRQRDVNWEVLASIYARQDVIDPSAPASPGNTRFHYPRNVDLGLLMLRITQDRIDGITPAISNPFAPFEMGRGQRALYVSEWITREMLANDLLQADGRWPAQMVQDAETQDLIRHRMEQAGSLKIPDEFHTIIDGDLPDLLLEYASIMAQLGEHDRTVRACMKVEPDGWYRHRDAVRLVEVSFRRAKPETRIAFADRLTEWVLDGTADQAYFAICVETGLHESVGRSESPATPEADRLRDALIQCVQAQVQNQRWHWRGAIQEQAASRLCERGDDPELVFPVIAEYLGRTKSEETARKIRIISEQAFAGYAATFNDAWIENFAPLASHENAEVRRWLAASVPVSSAALTDRRFDAVLDLLAADSDMYVAEEANSVRRERLSRRASEGETAADPTVEAP